MPRVVPEQKQRFENDELFRKLSRETEVNMDGRNIMLGRTLNFIVGCLARLNTRVIEIDHMKKEYKDFNRN